METKEKNSKKKEKGMLKKRKIPDCSLADKENGNKSNSFGQLFGENGAHLLLLLLLYPTLPLIPPCDGRLRLRLHENAKGFFSLQIEIICIKMTRDQRNIPYT